MHFQKSGDAFIVHVRRGEFPGAKKHWPAELALGTFSRTRGIDVWPAPYGTQTRSGSPPGWNTTAHRLIAQAAASGRILGGLKAHRKEERKTGSFIVRFSGGTSSRFHSFEDARHFAERKLLRMRFGSQALFYRHSETGRTGSPWTESFHAMMVVKGWDGKPRIEMGGRPRGTDPRRRPRVHKYGGGVHGPIANRRLQKLYQRLSAVTNRISHLIRHGAPHKGGGQKKGSSAIRQAWKQKMRIEQQLAQARERDGWRRR
jgi:hypothetical protein